MPSDPIAKELAFGLENLAQVFDHIQIFSQTDAPALLRTSALTYECVGYYNAIEHLIIRF
ncbi:MAG: hypothetical protein HZC40_10485 [Chloroflexi bacterium]|nr:hypothetical protein [Chloroflexota bacterium]